MNFSPVTYPKNNQLGLAPIEKLHMFSIQSESILNYFMSNDGGKIPINQSSSELPSMVKTLASPNKRTVVDVSMSM